MSNLGRKPKEPLNAVLSGVEYIAKQCSKCKGIKPLASFDRLWRSSDGRQPSCKSCKREQNSKRVRERKW